MHTKGGCCACSLTNLLGQGVNGCEQYLGCGEQARRREWHARDGGVIWGIPPEPTFRLGGDKEISYVTYRFYDGHDGGIPAGRATDRSGNYSR